MKTVATVVASLSILLFCSSLYAQDASQKLIDRLEKDVTRLEEENENLKTENAELKEEIERLKSSLPNAKKALDPKNPPTPMGTKWKGKYQSNHLGKTTTSNATFEVTARADKTVTFLQKIENGATWEFDCEYTAGNKFVIRTVRRLRAADAVVNDKNLPPVGGITGSGNADDKNLRLDFTWREARDGVMSGRFQLTKD